MRRSSSEEVRGSFNADVDRLCPRTIGREIILPLLTVAFAACVIAFGAAAFVRLLVPIAEALR